MHIIDISLCRPSRGKGTWRRHPGRHHRAPPTKSRASTISFHVERFNPAMRLYQRLGFDCVVEDRASIWRCDAARDSGAGS